MIHKLIDQFDHHFGIWIKLMSRRFVFKREERSKYHKEECYFYLDMIYHLIEENSSIGRLAVYNEELFDEGDIDKNEYESVLRILRKAKRGIGIQNEYIYMSNFGKENHFRTALDNDDPILK